MPSQMSSRARVGRSASHTGIPTSLLADRAAAVKVVGLPHGPRLGRSLSQGSSGGFSVQAIGMHYAPSPLVIPVRSSSNPLGVSPVLMKPDRTSSLTPPKRRSSLRHFLAVDTNLALQSQRAEIAMEIAEEVARLYSVNKPMTTDAPLCVSGTSSGHVVQVVRWLQARFDLDKSVNELIGNAVTAEALASEIIATATAVSPERPWCNTGEIPIMFEGFDLEISPEDMDFDSLDLVPADSIEINPQPVPLAEGDSSAFVSVACPPILVLPPPAPAEVRPLNLVKEKKPARNAVAADGKFSKKTGLAVGLLAVGALLGSPNHPSFEQFDLALPETPSPFTSHFAIPNSTESTYDRILEWQGSFTGGSFGIDIEPRLSPWSEGRQRMM